MSNKKRAVVPAVLLIVVVGGALFAYFRLRPAAPPLPTAQVTLGDFDISVKARGEVKALRSVTLNAPGRVQDVQIVRLVPSGTVVSVGDPVIELDPTAETDRLTQRESTMKQIDAELERLRAQQRMQDESDRVIVAQAEFDVEKARLEVKKQDIVSEIDAAKARLALGTAERRLAEVKEVMAGHKKQQAAAVDQIIQRRKSAERDYKLAQFNIDNLLIKTPISGIFQALPNRRMGMMRMGAGGAPAPEFRQGDRAWSGASIGEIPDLTSLAVELLIEETERGKVAVGQPARVKVDAFSDQIINGKIDWISPLSRIDRSTVPPQRSFRTIVSLELKGVKLTPKKAPPTQVAQDRPGPAQQALAAGMAAGMAGQGATMGADGQAGGRGNRGSRGGSGDVQGQGQMPGQSMMGAAILGMAGADAGADASGNGRRGGRDSQRGGEGQAEGSQGRQRGQGTQGAEQGRQRGEGGDRAGQRGEGATGGMDAAAREQMRQRFQNMSAEERAAAIQQFRQQGGQTGQSGQAGQGLQTGQGGDQARQRGEGGNRGGQRGEGGGNAGSGGLDPAALEQMRQRFQNMSPEERAAAIQQFRQGGGTGRPGGRPGMPQRPEVKWPTQKPDAAQRAAVGDVGLRPGMSTGADIVVNRLQNVVLIPVRASFDKGGKVIAYVRTDGRFEPREITVGHKNAAQIEVVSGLKPGEIVALEEPAQTKGGK